MRDNRIGFRIAKLLARQRAGQITDEEVRELEAWKGKLPENEELFLRWQKGDFFSGEYAKYKEIDVSRAKDIMQKRIDRERRAGWRLRVLRISVAAAVVLLAVGSFYFFKGEGDGKRDTVPSIALISAQRPTLKLNDGSVVLLDSVAAGFEEEGVTVSRRGGSTLAYLAGDTLGSGTLAYNTLNVPKGAEFNLVLADGTQVWLNAESKLKYPVVFGSEERVVELEGEGFFKVSKDASRPFRVKTKSQVVEVLGTEFNVRDYPGKPLAVTLVQGCVSVRENREDAEEILLEPGENASWRETGTLVVEKVDVRSYVAWKDGFFFYNDARLEDMLDELGRWYDFSVFYENPSVKDMRFKFWVNREEPPEKLVERLRELGILEVRWNGKSLVVSVK